MPPAASPTVTHSPSEFSAGTLMKGYRGYLLGLREKTGAGAILIYKNNYKVKTLCGPMRGEQGEPVDMPAQPEQGRAGQLMLLTASYLRYINLEGSFREDAQKQAEESTPVLL